MGNSYKALHVDFLHQSDVEIFKMFVGIIRDIAIENPRRHILQELDNRLMRPKEEASFAHFCILGNENKGLFQFISQLCHL